MKDTPRINPGWYGWLGDFHDVTGYYPTAFDRAYFSRHNINWFWLGHQWVIPFLLTETYRVQEAMVEFKKRARIWYELYWWGDHTVWGSRANPRGFACAHIPEQVLLKLHRSGARPGGTDLTGKDWCALAEHPKLLEGVEKTIRWQIETISRYCGDDALHGVILSEEEPIHGVGQVLGESGVRYYEEHKSRIMSALIKVHNHLYRFIKSSYPWLKVSPGFYPEWVRPGSLDLDAVCMDFYPDPGRERQALKTWERSYGFTGEQYMLLWGYGNRDRKFECARFDKTLSLILSKGFTNIGFFYPEMSLQDRIHRLFDVHGGNCGPHNKKQHAHDLRNLSLETNAVAKQLPSSVESRISDLPSPSRKRLSSDQRMRRFADRLYDFRERELDRAYDHVQRMKQLQKIDEITAILRSEGFLPRSSGKSPAPGLSQINEWEHNFSSKYETLPDYYSKISVPERQILSYMRTLSVALRSSLTGSLTRLPPHIRPHVSAAISGTARSLSRGDIERARRSAFLAYRALASAHRERSFVLRLAFSNRWKKPLNLRVTLDARWKDGSVTEIYSDEPFISAVSAPTLSLHLPERPLAILFRTSPWTGDVEIASLKITNSRGQIFPRRITAMKNVTRIATPAPDGKEQRFLVKPWSEAACATFLFGHLRIEPPGHRIEH